MTLEKVSDRKDEVRSIIRRAAEKNGQDFNYMLAQARLESGLNPEAKAKTSSATGLFQFTSGTWLDLIKRHGDKVGLGQTALALQNGGITAAQKADILARRVEPELSSELAARFAVENANALQRSGHEKIGSTELYIAHFLGPQGANVFLTGLKQEPNAPAAQALKQAASANEQVFYSGGKARTYSEIFVQLQNKLAGGALKSTPYSFGSGGALTLGTSANIHLPPTSVLSSDGLGPFKTGKMTTPAIDESPAGPMGETKSLATASRIFDELIGAGNSPSDNLSLDKEALGAFLHSFSLRQSEPGLTPITNDAESRDASLGVGSNVSGPDIIETTRLQSGHALGGRLNIKTKEKIDDVNLPNSADKPKSVVAPSTRPTFSNLAALWGGG